MTLGRRPDLYSLDVRMAPKYHPTPLSGGDRKALKKELRSARGMTGILAAQSDEMRSKGDALIRQYIATQIVAEYLKSFFGCDAIIYRSAMQRDEEQDLRNIVILNRDGFVGDADPYVLSYTGWSMEDVTDVRYTTVDGMVF